MSSILIAYYSYSASANTRKLAKLIQQRTGGTIFNIEPVNAYPAAYDACVEQAEKEIKASYRPSLKAGVQDISAFDIVFVGTPNWWSTMAPPVATFLEGHDFAGRTIVPFCTNGGGGSGRVERDIAKLVPNSTVLPGLIAYEGSAREADVSGWLKRIGVVTN